MSLLVPTGAQPHLLSSGLLERGRGGAHTGHTPGVHVSVVAWGLHRAAGVGHWHLEHLSLFLFLSPRELQLRLLQHSAR